MPGASYHEPSFWLLSLLTRPKHLLYCQPRSLFPSARWKVLNPLRVAFGALHVLYARHLFLWLLSLLRIGAGHLTAIGALLLRRGRATLAQILVSICPVDAYARGPQESA